MVRVIVREVVIQLSKTLDKVETPYLMFRADRLRLDAAVTTYGRVGHASLGAIQLVDKIHVGTTGAYMELLTTKPGTDLISALYRQVHSHYVLFLSSYLLPMCLVKMYVLCHTSVRFNIFLKLTFFQSKVLKK